MKNTFFFFITIIISGIIIIGSYFFWTSKVDNATTNTELELVVEDNKDKKSNDKKDKSKKNKEETSEDSDEIDLSERHEGIHEQLLSRVEDDKPVRFLMIGSKRTVSDNVHLADAFKDRLEPALANLLELDEITMMDDSIFSFYNSDTYAAHKDNEYDFVIMEPFMLNNQGVLSYDDTESYINDVLADWADKDTLVIVQPSAKTDAIDYIIERHNHLVEFMSGRPEVFIDAWAEIAEDENIEDYVGEGGTPNDDGINLWADELASYFVHVKE